MGNEVYREDKQLVPEAKRAGVGHPLDQEVPRILERRQSFGKGAGRGGVARAGRPTAEILMGPFVVVQRPEAIEGALLRGEIGPRRTTGPGFQGAVHAFVCSVLLGRGGVNTLMLDPEAHPPDVELREAMDTARREGDAVVGPDRARQTELAKGALEDGTGAPAFDVRQPPTREQIARVLPHIDSPVVGFALLPGALLVVAQLVAAYAVLRHRKPAA